MTESFPFGRIDAKAAAKLESKEALDLFQRHGFLWIQQDCPATQSESILTLLRDIHNNNPACLARKWSIENTGSSKEKDLSVDKVLGKSDTCKRFYVSTIISRKKDEESLEEFLQNSLKSFWNTESALTPPILGDCKHKGGAWLFLGRNQDGETDAKRDSKEPRPKKSKRNSSNTALIGRAEHVDDVLHSGTWHVQVAGKKTWFLRPNSESEDWEEDCVPNLRTFVGTSQANQPHVQVQESDGGQVRLCCHVEEGDLFVLNTKAWYHRTELPADNQSWSISVARDFSLPIPQVFCPRNVGEGEVVLQEDDIPDQFPTAEMAEEVANCTLAEVAVEEEDEYDGQNDEAATNIVLVALRDIQKGEPLLLESVDEDQEDDEDEEENAPESIDPRVIAKKAWKKGDIVLSGDAIPEDIPLSLEANCKLEERDGGLVLRTFRDIESGDVFTIAPEEGDDLDEYEEVEVKLGDGELTRRVS